MLNTYFNRNLKITTIFLVLCFFIGFFQKTKAFTSSFEIKSVVEKKQVKIFDTKNNIQSQEKSTKKPVLESKSTKSKIKKKKISFQKKLSILKLVLKNKHHNKGKISIQESTKWNGQHTAGLLSWASFLVAVMAFFTSHFLLGILASCSAILFLSLIFVERGSRGTVDDVLWIFAQIINIIVIIGSIFD